MRTFLNVIARVMIGAGAAENSQPPRRKYARQEIISFRGREKNCIQKQLLLTFSVLLMVSLKFEVKAAKCKPVGG